MKQCELPKYVALPVKLMLSHDDSLLRKFNPFCFEADLITTFKVIWLVFYPTLSIYDHTFWLKSNF